MIETIYNKETTLDEAIKLPKNIRQIGPGESTPHIYIEDKIEKFIKLCPENEKEIRYGVLLGNVKYAKGEMYSFINGIVEVKDVIEHMVLFGDDIWTGIYEDIKKYYNNKKIVGWYVSELEGNEKNMRYMEKMHLDHFAGNDKILLLYNREEEEKTIYAYKREHLERVLSYHIYYEKNLEVENYIFSTHYNLKSKTNVVETRTKAIVESKRSDGKERISEMKDEKSNEKKQKDIYRGITVFSGKAAALFVIGACVFTIGGMYKKGQLEHFSSEMKEVVAGIMKTGEETNLGDIVVLDTEETAANQEQTSTVSTIETQTEMETEEEKETIQEESTEGQTTDEASVLPENTQQYIVEKGDTLYGICKKLYGNTDNLKVIMKLNNLDSEDNIYYGKTLIVP